jgi:histidinol dehydrogenase
MNGPFLKRVKVDELPTRRRDPIDAEAMAAAAKIVQDVQARGEEALIEHAIRLGDLAEGEPLILTREDLKAAFDSLDADTQGVLTRTSERIQAFAEFQKSTLIESQMKIEGGAAGQTIAPMERAGCYAPGGRYPLPSSVLMTAVTARVAGVKEVWVASPKPTVQTKAAAYVAKADCFLAAGGAQAITALAYGAGRVPACQAVVGPGNKYVTAAKALVAGRVAIDMLAGPSELLVLADETAPPELVAADLLAQAEHDPDALPVLVTLDELLIEKVEVELEAQLVDLPTGDIARAALENGFVVFAPNIETAIAICDRLAPEHLEVMTKNPEALATRLNDYGALFLGPQSAEVLGDYGAGPNHVLPTSGAAKITGGLSVFNFLRVRTWMTHDATGAPKSILADSEKLARIEGLEAHARAAKRR